MAVIGACKPKNLVHIVINNGAHETVGGMSTVARDLDLVNIAKGCGYPIVVSVDNEEVLGKTLETVKEYNQLSFVEIKCAIGSRGDLGRPTTTTIENKQAFMELMQMK